MAKSKKLTAQIARNLLRDRVNTGGDPLEYAQNLNLVGVDAKGALSSCHAMNGLAADVGAKVDVLGSWIPFVHAGVSAKISAEGTANGLLSIHRGPAQLWRVAVPSVPAADQKTTPVPPPHWVSKTPLLLNYLRGKSAKATLSGGANAWAGIGNVKDIDETGLGAGLFVDAQVEGRITALTCNQPQSFGPSIKSDGLTSAVEDLMVDQLKRKAALWLLANGNGIKEAAEHGAVVTPPSLTREVLEHLAITGLKSIPEWTKVGLSTFHYNENTTTEEKVGTANALGNVVTVFGHLRKLGTKVLERVRGNKLNTKELIDQLETAVERLNEAAVIYRTFQDFPSEVLNRTGGVARGYSPRSGAVPAAYRSYNDDTITSLLKISEMRIKEGEDLIKRLKKRKAARAAKQDPNPAWAHAPRDAKIPATDLRLGTFLRQFTGTAVASATANIKHQLSEDTFGPMFALGAKGQLDSYYKKITIAFQYPTKGVVRGRTEATLMTSQQSVVTHGYYAARAEAKAAAVNRRAAVSGEYTSLVTMSYYSLIASWFPDPGGRSWTHQTELNTSGISFGLSMLRTRLKAYQTAMVAGDTTGPGTAKIEEILMRQLRVSKAEIRRFIRSVPEDLLDSDPEGEEGNALLVESAFAFSEQHEIALQDPAPKKLADLPPARHLLDNEGPDEGAYLQSIRLRYRVQSDDAKTTTLFRLGLSKKPFDDPTNPLDQEENKAAYFAKSLVGMPTSEPDGIAEAVQILPISLGVGASWVTRTCSEGIVDLHICVFPDDPPDKPAKNWSAHMWTSECILPGVTLFYQ